MYGITTLFYWKWFNSPWPPLLRPLAVWGGGPLGGRGLRLLDPLLHARHGVVEERGPGLVDPLFEGERFRQPFLLQPLLGVVGQQHAADDRLRHVPGAEGSVPLIAEERGDGDPADAEARRFPQGHLAHALH